ncbi:hypothetical protein [Leptospira barantonii]|uniref:Uncharacterized protein n=1 Tax=Leptospira barantonii TaxID=2023184 RepID=A0ABX4NGP5_9LEPT|nr:hypothetical protein [Leptospira barantonii]PJZ55985.1 hypothetical protein CH367_16855 [Leptospira barantonii]
MNVSGLTIQSFSFSWPRSVESEALSSGPTTTHTQSAEKDVRISDSIPQKTKPEKNEIKPEELVMKPSPVSFEERMNQVISPEQMKNLLSMMVRSRMSENPTDHKIDVRR